MKPHEQAANVTPAAIVTNEDHPNNNNNNNNNNQDQHQHLHYNHHHHRARGSGCCCHQQRRGRLFSFLDLRFADPKLEQEYHIYYAQVKRNLLPTAIQVVLLVNFSQLVTTCLSYCLLDANSDHHETNRHSTIHNNHKISSSQAQSQLHTSTTSTTTATNSHELQTFPKALLWPFLLQILIFVIAIPMFLMVKAEKKPTSQSNEQSVANNRDLKFKQTRQQRRARQQARRSSDNCDDATNDH
jgi:hypothetical protein